MNLPRLVFAIILSAFAGAALLAVLLIVLANLDTGQPMFHDASFVGSFWMTVAFCFFTFPVALCVGFPLVLVLIHFNLMRLWVCISLGSVAGVFGFYGLVLLPGVKFAADWRTVLWLALSGAAAGTVFWLSVRIAAPVLQSPLVSQNTGSAHGIVLYDGVCNLCNGSVAFIIARDPAAHFCFMPLQSEAARVLLDEHVLNDSLPDSIALIERGCLYMRSTAALRIARRLSFPWPSLYALIIVPRRLRDAIYDFIARHRYAWFGKRGSCMLPTPELRSRFLT